MKVAVSALSAAHALQNLDAEIPHWDFETVRDKTRAKWDQELSRIQIEGTPEQKETFYTSLYHAFLAPNLYQDVTGEYRGFDQNTQVRPRASRTTRSSRSGTPTAPRTRSSRSSSGTGTGT